MLTTRCGSHRLWCGVVSGVQQSLQVCAYTSASEQKIDADQVMCPECSRACRCDSERPGTVEGARCNKPGKCWVRQRHSQVLQLWGTYLHMLNARHEPDAFPCSRYASEGGGVQR